MVTSKLRAFLSLCKTYTTGWNKNRNAKAKRWDFSCVRKWGRSRSRSCGCSSGKFMYEASLTWLRTMILLPLGTFMIGLLACQSVQKETNPLVCHQHVISTWLSDVLTRLILTSLFIGHTEGRYKFKSMQLEDRTRFVWVISYVMIFFQIVHAVVDVYGMAQLISISSPTTGMFLWIYISMRITAHLPLP